MRNFIFKDAEGKECEKYNIWIFHNEASRSKIHNYKLRGITLEQEKQELFDMYKAEIKPHSYEVYENKVLVDSGLIENLTTTP